MTDPSRKEFREELNKSIYLHRHKHGTSHYGNRKRAYGDYLFHQDRDKFEVDYVEWLEKKRAAGEIGGRG